MIGLSIFGFLALNFLIFKLDEEAQHIKNAENSVWQVALSEWSINSYCDSLQRVWKCRREHRCYRKQFFATPFDQAAKALKAFGRAAGKIDVRYK